MGYYLTFFVLAFMLSGLLIVPSQKVAHRYQLYVTNQPGRLFQQKRLPLLGGIPLLLGFVLMLLFFCAWAPQEEEISIAVPSHQLMALLFGVSLVSLAGLLQDLYPKFTAHLKVSFYLAAAFLLVISQIRTNIEWLGFGQIDIGRFSFDVGNALVTILWVLIVMGTLDLLESVEGLVVGIGVVAGAFLFVISTWSHNYGNAFLSLVFTATLSGIFWNQLPPSTCSLGKTGSAFVGFVLAALTLNVAWSEYNEWSVLIPALLLCFPLTLAGIWAFGKCVDSRISLPELWKTLEHRGMKNTDILTAMTIVMICTGITGLLLFAADTSSISGFVLCLAGLTAVVAAGILIGYVRSPKQEEEAS